MPELNDTDAIKLALVYYSKQFPTKDAVHLVNILRKVGIVGLIIYVYERGVLDERAEKA